MKILKFLLPAMLLAACSTTPQFYRSEQPRMDFITYFSGTTHGYGAIFSRSGQVTDRFHVIMHGTPGTNAQGQRTLQLAEDFTYTSGKTQKRGWSVTEPFAGKLIATAPDVPSGATGIQSGNAVQFGYDLTIKRDNGKSITLGSNDWMWMMPGNTLLNRNTLTKFGFKVAELVITFTKNP